MAASVADSAADSAAERRIAAEQAAGRLPPLLAQAWRLAETVARGGHGRRRAGPGDAFWQYRPYESGEPAHRIDWRRSARSDGLFVRQRERETAQTVLLWRDASPSMAWSSAPRLATKRAVAELLVLASACLLSRGGERVMLAEAGARSGRNGIGPAALDRVALTLARQQAEAGTDLPNPEGLPARAELVICSDFLMPWGALEPALKLLRDAGLRCHLVQILDPAEEDLPYQGRVRFDGIEEGGSLLVPRVEALRAEYRLQLAALRDSLAAFTRHAGWSLSFHRTDRPATTALLALWGALADRPVSKGAA